MMVLSDKDVIKDLQKKLSNRKRKRERIKRVKDKAYKEKQLRIERIEKANKNINEWQKQELSKLEEQLRVCSLVIFFFVMCWKSIKTRKLFCVMLCSPSFFLG